jgi:hypothetical protein
MTTESKTKADFRSATESKKAPKAVADGVAGMILAIAEVSGTPEQAVRALTTDEILKWWRFPGTYHQKTGKPICASAARGASPSSLKPAAKFTAGGPGPIVHFQTN